MSLVRDPKGTIWDDESLEKVLIEVLTAEVDEDTAQRLVEAIVGVLQDGEYAVMKETDFQGWRQVFVFGSLAHSLERPIWRCASSPDGLGRICLASRGRRGPHVGGVLAVEDCLNGRGVPLRTTLGGRNRLRGKVGGDGPQ